jgi:hypothetical protein
MPFAYPPRTKLRHAARSTPTASWKSDVFERERGGEIFVVRAFLLIANVDKLAYLAKSSKS